MSRAGRPAGKLTANRLRPIAAAVIAASLLAAPAAVASAATTATALGSHGRTATTEPAPLRVTLDALTPLIPTPERTLDLRGTVANSTDQEVADIAVRLLLRPYRLTDRAEIAAIASENAADQIPGGSPPASPGESPSQSTSPAPALTPYSDYSVTIPGSLPPGAGATWRLTVPFADLPLGSPGVYAVGAQAYNPATGESLGEVETFIPWFPQPAQVQPTKVVWLWPLADYPARNADGTLLDGRTPQELAPGGRLRLLLESGLRAPNQITWLADPELLDTAESMSHGYLVEQPDGRLLPGDAVPAAADWLSTARTGLRNFEVTALPYAVPDVTALRRQDLDGDVVLSSTLAAEAATRVLGRAVSGGMAWPPGGLVDRRTLELLHSAGARTVVLDESNVPLPSPLSYTPTGTSKIKTQAGDMQVVVRDRGLAETLAMPQRTRSEMLLARQRFFAETAAVTAQQPDDSRTIVAAPDVRWSADPAFLADALQALRMSPWARSASLRSLLQSAAPEVDRSLRTPDAAERALELPASYLNRVRSAQIMLDEIGAIAEDPGSVTQRFRAALLRAESGAWRHERGLGRDLVGQVLAEVRAEQGKVRVVSSGTVSFPSEGGRVPVTIANDLDTPVRVGLRLRSDPPVRLVSDPIAPLLVPPHRKVSAEIDAKVLGTGALPVDVLLVTAAGQVYGQPAHVQLRTTAYARAAGWVVAAAFAVLVVLIGFNFVRRRKARVRARAAGPGPS